MSADAPLADVLAVLVLYDQPLEESPTFLSLGAGLRALGARLELLVYDNSPKPSAHPPARLTEGWDVHFVHDPSNPGVSRAYREGATLARRRAKRWLLLLDQDTWFPADALSAYLAAVERYPTVRLFAPVLRAAERVVSPCRYRLKRGVGLRRVEPGPHSLAGRSVLNSGLWVALDDYLAAGGHDERIRLDFADHEFVERFKRRHDRFVVVAAECRHGLSAADAQSPAVRLARFRAYCLGARYSSHGVADRALTAGVVALRACLLAVRHRSLRFLGVAAATLARGDPA